MRIVSLSIITTIISCLPVAAGNPASTATMEFGVLTGYGISHIGMGDTRHQVQTFDILPRFGYFLSGELGRGHWFQGRHEAVLELPYHLAVDQGGRSMAGASLLGHWRFTGLDTLTPYLFAGGGPLYVDIGLPTMGAKLCFTYQGGTGIQYYLSSSTALNLEYRYHHISNAGTASPNEPINSTKILFGISWYR